MIRLHRLPGYSLSEGCEVVFCPSSITEWSVLDCAHIQLRAVPGKNNYYVSQSTTSLLQCMHHSSGAMFLTPLLSYDYRY